MATFNGTSGNDTASAQTATVTGFAGGTVGDLTDLFGDVFLGQSGDDAIGAGSGNDTITGGAGADAMFGNAGNDTFNLGFHSDLVAGEVIDGGAGADTIAILGGLGHTYDFRNVTLTSIEAIEVHNWGPYLRFNAVQFGGYGLAPNLVIIDLPATAGSTAAIYPEIWMDTAYYLDLSQVQFVGVFAESAPFTSIVGDADAETVIGSSIRDLIYGGAGSDYLEGRGGGDELQGAAGYDLLYGGDGNDRLEGGGDEDVLAGGIGDDRMLGGAGNDVLSELFTPTGSGNDWLEGGLGIDIIYAADGNDLVYGSDFGAAEATNADLANNYANLGAGDDDYTGSGGTDVVEGGDGFDHINGMLGHDSLYGGADDDVIYGDGDVAGPTDGSTTDGIDLLSGGGGNDTLWGRGNNDLLVGDAGNDTLLGGQGIDVLYGGANDDVLNGGPDVDALYGGMGADSFQVGGAGYGYDYVWDFQPLAGPSDRLVFSIDNFSSVAQIRSASVFSGGNTWISVPNSNGSVVVLVGVNIANVLNEDLTIGSGF